MAMSFYASSLIQHIPKHNILIIGGDMNSQICKNKNDKFCFYNLPNKNSKSLANFLLDNNLACLKTKFKKREGKLWTYTKPNNSKAQLDYLFIIKKWINSTLNSKVYSSFEGVSSNHRIVLVNIHLNHQKYEMNS